jgi:hypothetical protein
MQEKMRPSKSAVQSVLSQAKKDSAIRDSLATGESVRPLTGHPSVVVTSIRAACTRSPTSVATRMMRPVQQLMQPWQALQADVRRARHAGEPQRIQHYVLGGAKLARLGVFDEVGVLQHMTRTQLHTARNPGLAPSWCKACLEQLAAALNELRGLLGPRGARAAAAIEAAVRHGNLGPAVPG